VASDAEAQGPADHVSRAADQAPRAHNIPLRPRRQAAGASRPPPTMVRPHGALVRRMSPSGTTEGPTGDERTSRDAWANPDALRSAVP